MIAVFSTGLSWCFAALLVGLGQRSSARAAVASTALLLGATAVYYLLIIEVSQRWRGGFLDSGEAADRLGLYSVGLSATFWVVASLGVGPVLGVVAWRMTTGGNRESAVLAGGTAGLLSGQGWYTLLFLTPWPIPDEFSARLLLSAILTITLSALALGYLVRRLGLRMMMGHVVFAAVAGGALGLALWRLVAVARMSLGV
ncbi:hypothetical protein QEZ54_01050 [Catellatospora sp. KI3]|uniref:hypothetical protein n=1 Tax=Catellatospora sp. KI3 TaxID=3041620 RepID=UPI00248210A8|nr:hypothetical protein [Catellatospora sp. KI3]MDI1459543.1 hypothetical protein [Catellatospora sp. KI3]